MSMEKAKYKKFGLMLRNIRTDGHITIDEVSNALNISPESIEDIENCRVLPSVLYCYQFTQFMGRETFMEIMREFEKWMKNLESEEKWFASMAKSKITSDDPEFCDLLQVERIEILEHEARSAKIREKSEDEINEMMDSKAFIDLAVAYAHIAMRGFVEARDGKVVESEIRWAMNRIPAAKARLFVRKQ